MTKRYSLVLALLTALSSLGAQMVSRATPENCGPLAAHRSAPASGVPRTDTADRRGIRAFAVQFKQDLRFVESYATYRQKMRCMMETYVVPNLSPDVPNLVVFNEDIGLMTLAIGSRGKAVREFAKSRAGKAGGDQSGAPAGAAGALGLANGAYASQVAYYQAKFPGIDPRKQVFLAATDTFARAFSQTFSDIARDYGVYVVASNNQGLFEESTDPADVAALGDPDLLPGVSSVYVATGPEVWNQVFLWGPEDTAPDAPAPERNVLFRNKKVPLTAIEKDFIALDEGPSTGPGAAANIGAAAIPGSDAKLGFATSLPAFVYGYNIGSPRPAVNACSNTAVYYMPCMSDLGVNVVVQAEANPGRWASLGGQAEWQPFEWMGSTWRAVADPTVNFRYNITPHMVGNLLDLAFDGQTAITSRDGGYPAAHYVGNVSSEAESEQGDPEYSFYIGDKDQFVTLAPWVNNTDDRELLRATSTRLAPASDDPLENDYLETVLWADLVF
ncbi:MAG: hypothetical protein ABR548_01675 [Actinomycetota bacterium]|nr:hypothetical protein [Actinomycetota bacterium]